MPRKSWFEIKNAAADSEDPAEIYIYDVIGLWGISATDFITQLKAVTASAISLRINSPGGDVFVGAAIANALQRHSATINVHIDGLAASMASVIAMSGDTITMAENALMMIHNPNWGASGESEDFRKAADVLDKIKQTIVTAYANKTGLPDEEISQLMDDETWMNAAEAMEKGFCDSITEADEAATNIAKGFDLRIFAKAPALTPRAQENMATEPSFLEKLITALKGKSLEEATAHIANLGEQLTALTLERDTALTNLKTATDSVATLTSERNDFKAQAEAATALVDAAKAKLKDQASALAVDILASLGVPPIAAETPEEKGNVTNSVEAAVAAFNAETDPVKRGKLYEAVQAAWKGK